MTSDRAGPVALAEVHDVVEQLTSLHARAVESGQDGYAMVLHLAAASLADNIECVEGIDDDAA